MNVRDLFNPAAKATAAKPFSLSAFLSRPAVPTRFPPCAADLWREVVAEKTALGECFTSLDVEEEVGRRFDASHARLPGLFGSDPGEEQR